MKNKFQKYIIDNQLFTHSDNLIVAVSGGMDSMVLVCLLYECGYRFDIAHCNFTLRGAESDEDEKFVKHFASFISKKCHVKHFDTAAFAAHHKMSIQEAARDLRYSWFAELREKHDYQAILTAHHGSDSVETMLFNFSRGAGLRGLTGIKSINGAVKRPLLGITKDDILQYVKENDLIFREDSSNESDKYARNFIRHHIVPLFKKINPDFEKTALHNLNRVEEAQVLLDFFINDIKQKITQSIDNHVFIDKNLLNAYPSVKTVLFEILKDFNFNTNHIDQIYFEYSDKNKIGTKFYSATHELLIDRHFYIVKPLKMPENEPITEGVDFMYIRGNTDILNLNDVYILVNQLNTSKYNLTYDKNVCQLDYEKLIFPLKLRHWQAGDKFQPLGMHGQSQLLSDYFQQQKISNFDKEKVWILENGDGIICWIMSYRMSEIFKITNTTTRVLVLNAVSRA